MRVIVTENFEQTCEIAAGIIMDVIRKKPDARLGLATGSTAQGVYPYLVRANQMGEVDFLRVNTVNLDEYVGLPADHPERYRNVIDTVFVSRVDFAVDAVQSPDGLAADIPAACAAYDAAIRAAGGVAVLARLFTVCS